MIVSNEADQQLSRLETLWVIQATITALVYPIVLAFVALLFQRTASAKATLRVYLVESGAFVAGMSAVLLVAAIGLPT